MILQKMTYAQVSGFCFNKSEMVDILGCTEDDIQAFIWELYHFTHQTKNRRGFLTEKYLPGWVTKNKELLQSKTMKLYITMGDDKECTECYVLGTEIGELRMSLKGPVITRYDETNDVHVELEPKELFGKDRSLYYISDNYPDCY